MDPTSSYAARAGLRASVAACLLGTALAGCIPSTQGPITFWAVEETRPLPFDTALEVENAVFSAPRREVRLSAARNETVAFQIALQTAAPPVGPLEIRIGDFTGSLGALAARDAIRLYRMQSVTVESFSPWYVQQTGRPPERTEVHDILVPWSAPRGGGPIVLGGRRPEFVWVDVRVPASAAPGIYTAPLQVGPAQGPALYSAVVHLSVLSAELPAAPGLDVVCRVDPTDLLHDQLAWPIESPENTRILPDEPAHAPAVALVSATLRLLQEHRTTPVLMASLPKFRATGPRELEIEWEPYDRLVEPFVRGTAYANGIAPRVWPLPVSERHPDVAREGGYDSLSYGRLLVDYLRACEAHFAQRGWSAQPFVRIVPPGPPDEGAYRAVERLGEVLARGAVQAPLVAHLPSRSLRGLGWQAAPRLELPQVAIWAPPARWWEPEPMRRQRDLARRTWFLPDHPPYSGSLATAAPAGDAQVLGWQAFRYGADGIWIEHAVDRGDPGGSAPLVYSGRPYGLSTDPVPSVRLKRLRRGLEDCELLKALASAGKADLAGRIAEQLVPWAFLDACTDDLLTGRPSGWPSDPHGFLLARRLVLSELAGGSDAADTRADWERLMRQAPRVLLEARGARLVTDGASLKALVSAALTNRTDHTLSGRLGLVRPPLGWTPAEVELVVPARSRIVAQLDVALEGLAFSADGVVPYELRFEPQNEDAVDAPGRLAVAVCPSVSQAIEVDGDLRDWPTAANHAAGAFWVVNAPLGTVDRSSHEPTRAVFARDDRNLYVAVVCGMTAAAPPIATTDNRVPLAGNVPWGQDLVEILLSPENRIAGTGADLYCLQIKPNGVAIGRLGCRTDPPMNPSQPWLSDGRVAVRSGGGAWTVEVGIPLAALPESARNNRVWGVNVARVSARLGEYSSWSGAAGTCYRPELLGNLLVEWR